MCASSATSSRRSPAVRRRRPWLRPTSSGRSASRRRRRKSARAWRSTGSSMGRARGLNQGRLVPGCADRFSRAPAGEIVAGMTRIALITGGNRGIGRSTALHVDADVILTYRSNAGEAAAVVGEIEALGRRAAALPLDVGDVRSFGGFADAVGDALRGWDRDRFDFLVNNRGMNRTAPFAEFTEADFDALVDVHFKGVFFLPQPLLGLLADGGAIVNLSTGLTRLTG